MKIGIIVDGQSEYQGLCNLFPRINTPNQILNPIYCDIQPYSTVGQIAYSISKKMPILLTRDVDHIIILLDKETRK